MDGRTDRGKTVYPLPLRGYNKNVLSNHASKISYRLWLSAKQYNSVFLVSREVYNNDKRRGSCSDTAIYQFNFKSLFMFFN
jgi:hypothetical protein